MKAIIATVIALAAGGLIHVIGGAMWNLADEMPIWWNGDDEDERG